MHGNPPAPNLLIPLYIPLLTHEYSNNKKTCIVQIFDEGNEVYYVS
jgi:hypothetical protein